MSRIGNILAGLASGPILAALVLLIPLGMLIGLSAALDPSLAINEFTPEAELFVPFILLAVFVSAANMRLAWLMPDQDKSHRIITVRTARYRLDPSGYAHLHGHRGERLAADVIAFLRARLDPSVSLGEPEPQDFGWRFSARKPRYSPLWVVIAHVLEDAGTDAAEDFLLSVTLEPPLLPWGRLIFRPDTALCGEIERHLLAFLQEKGLTFTSDFGLWVDPEPKVSHGPMF